MKSKGERLLLSEGESFMVSSCAYRAREGSFAGSGAGDRGSSGVSFQPEPLGVLLVASLGAKCPMEILCSYTGPPRTVSISQSSVSKQQAPAERGPALSAPARPQAAAVLVVAGPVPVMAVVVVTVTVRVVPARTIPAGAAPVTSPGQVPGRWAQRGTVAALAVFTIPAGRCQLAPNIAFPCFIVLQKCSFSAVSDESEEGNLPHGCILKSRCRSDCFLPKHAALRQGTGQVFVELAGNGSLGLQHHPNLGCSNSACFEGPQQKGGGHLLFQEGESSGVGSDVWRRWQPGGDQVSVVKFISSMGKVPCVVPHRPSCQGSRAEHLYCTGRRRFSLQPTISEAEPIKQWSLCSMRPFSVQGFRKKDLQAPWFTARRADARQRHGGKHAVPCEDSQVINYSEWYCTAGQLHLQVLAEHYLRVLLNLALLPMDAFEECNIYTPLEMAKMQKATWPPSNLPMGGDSERSWGPVAFRSATSTRMFLQLSCPLQSSPQVPCQGIQAGQTASKKLALKLVLNISNAIMRNMARRDWKVWPTRLEKKTGGLVWGWGFRRAEELQCSSITSLNDDQVRDSGAPSVQEKEKETLSPFSKDVLLESMPCQDATVVHVMKTQFAALVKTWMWCLTKMKKDGSGLTCMQPHTQTKRRHKAPHTSTQPSEEHADIQVLAHTSGARKRVQMWFIKAPSRCRCCTTTKTETALREICSMYGDYTVIIVTLLIVARVLVAVRLSPPEEQLHLCADVAAAMEEAEPGLPLHSSLGAY
ncbi:hypothetical protein Anapl_01525 [Anas platyrhynchos]|uniref:Uncharacterized protein n=1 Tax=Anas platyrhynchos TaxID=8839 RepID=R0L859_ANAPL|nr:hypothetical protein Anapl_01525 [Anas platyrhynchos]